MTGPDNISLRQENQCARPGCANPVPRNDRGRPRLYCAPACRTARTATSTPTPAPRCTVDHGSTSSRRRPAGHVWLVRLRRGNHQAIIAIGLGRPSAEHLASQIREVINPPPGAPPPRIR